MSNEPQRPTGDNRDEWSVYWTAQGTPWRTEQEIDVQRQRYLSERRTTPVNVGNGTYAFKDVRLDRADIEWLLVTHENGRGPVNWLDENQRERKGLDLRGALLQGAQLSGLPLSCMQGALAAPDAEMVTRFQRRLALVHLENANLFGTRLEAAELSRAHLEGADLTGAHLERANLFAAHLEGTNLSDTHLEGADFAGAFLDPSVYFHGTYLYNKAWGSLSVADVRWNGANVTTAHWNQVPVLQEEYRASQK